MGRTKTLKPPNKNSYVEYNDRTLRPGVPISSQDLVGSFYKRTTPLQDFSEFSTLLESFEFVLKIEGFSRTFTFSQSRFLDVPRQVRLSPDHGTHPLRPEGLLSSTKRTDAPVSPVVEPGDENLPHPPEVRVP